MKKIIIGLIFCSLFSTQTYAMKKKYNKTVVASDKRDNNQPAQLEEDYSYWDMLPVEVKQQILLFAPSQEEMAQAKSLMEVLDNLKNLRSVCKEFDELINDEQFISILAKKYLEMRPEKSINEFLKACIVGNIFLFKVFMRAGIDLTLISNVCKSRTFDLLRNSRGGDSETRELKNILGSTDFPSRIPWIVSLLEAVKVYRYSINEYTGNYYDNNYDENYQKKVLLTVGNVALILALSCRCDYIIKKLIKYDVALIAAISKNPYGNFIPEIKLLIENGADVTSKDEESGKTLLMRAINMSFRRHYNLDVVQFLIQHGAQVNYEIPESTLTPLEIAIEEGDKDILKLLLVNNVRCSKQSCKLVFLIGNNDVEAIKEIIDKRGDINAYIGGGKTALMWAAMFGHLELVDLFILHGAHGAMRDFKGRTLLMLAAESGHTETVQRFLDYYYGIFIDIDAQDNDDETALMKAAQKGYVEVVRLLLTNGADLGVQTEYSGITALIVAVENSNTQVVKLLIENGADVNARDGERDTALLRAGRKAEHTEIVKVLLGAGADVKAHSYARGATVLIRAAMSGWDQEMVKLLLQAGADINARDNYSRTALLWAADEGHVEIIKLLLDKGAHINVQDMFGYTALMFAASHGHRLAVKVLVNAGAQVDTKDNDGKNALLYAIKEGYAEIVQLLTPKDCLD